MERLESPTFYWFTIVLFLSLEDMNENGDCSSETSLEEEEEEAECLMVEEEESLIIEEEEEEALTEESSSESEPEFECDNWDWDSVVIGTKFCVPHLGGCKCLIILSWIYTQAWLEHIMYLCRTYGMFYFDTLFLGIPGLAPVDPGFNCSAK